ncbi:MAG TPA: GH3 auxin-responsive promoter family protein [Anaerolineales bacterium]|nr:GH3 auxin-responsive promoter family protein [Anaerolineales bacterium]
MNSRKLLEEGRRDELWTKHCGFFTLKPDEFMDVQKRLLLEQIDLLGKSQIGKEIFGNTIPTSVEQFRQNVPLTTYSDYQEHFDKQNEEVLPIKPFVWARTSGRTSNKGPKWIPYTKAMYDHLGDLAVGAMLMASASYSGEVRLERNDKFLLATAPPPYVSAFVSRSAQEQLDVKFLPPLEQGENMEYARRIALGFRLAMREGMDYFMGLASVLARMGEQFEQQSGSTKFSKELMDPATLWRLIKAVIIAKLNKRNILPKDIWKLKGIMTGGADTLVYGNKIEYYWGKKPLQGFGCTEGGNLAMQGWNGKGMVFSPDIVFLEFIPLDEHLKNKADPSFIPRTLLYNELELGIYELVLTNFHGGALTRYRIGDLFEVIAPADAELGSTLPQMRFYSRADDVIDLGNLVRLTEKDIWKAIEATSVKYQDWIARKEFNGDNVILNIYLELKPAENVAVADYSQQLALELSKLSSEFSSLVEILGVKPIQISLLKPGLFDEYMKQRQQEGADLAHIKPAHMQPSDQVMKRLFELESSLSGTP